MTRQIPSYLRLHTAESLESRARGRRPSEDPAGDFWQVFADSTGWAPQPRRDTGGITLRSALPLDGVVDGEAYEQMPLISHTAAGNLAAAANGLLSKLRQTETSLRETEAKLAALEVAPITGDPAHGNIDAGQLSRRIDEVLEDIAISTDCQAVGMYMLDEATSQLKLRAIHGWDAQQFSAQPRQLRGALADLEALVGSVVEVDCRLDRDMGDSPFASAMCVAINVADTPVGTLWIWSKEGRTFSPRDQRAAKLASQLLARELTFDRMQQRSQIASKAVRPLRAASAWQERQQPLAQSPAPGWDVSGWTETPLALAGSWFHWDILPDGSLALVIAEARGTGYDAAMMAATARAAWQSHSGYRHDPAQMLRRIGDTLWGTNSGDQIVSLAYAQLDPETGDGMLASAGDISGIVASRFGYRPLFEANQPLGITIDGRPKLRQIQLQPGELLLAYTPGLVQAVGRADDSAHITQQRVAQLARSQPVENAAAVLARLRREAASLGPAKADRTVLAVARQQITAP